MVATTQVRFQVAATYGVNLKNKSPRRPSGEAFFFFNENRGSILTPPTYFPQLSPT